MTRAGNGRTLFVDGSAGAAGDMLLAALVDAGAPPARVRAALATLPVAGWTLSFRRVERCALAGRQARVRLTRAAGRDPHGRGWSALRRIVRAADLPPRAQRRALAAFRALIEAEAHVHGVSPGRVHLHEAGGVDAIVDVVGVAVALELLDVARVVVSPLTTGFGEVACAHGTYPVPAPATLRLCAGVPVQAGSIRAERLTPTGAALLTTLADAWGELPPIVPEAVGHGAGARDLSPHPNMLRVVIGRAPGPAGAKEADGGRGGSPAPVRVLECQIDDATPQELAWIADELLAAGALDVWRAPVTMKKGRLGTLLSVVCRPAESGALVERLLAGTPTLGVRLRDERRVEAPRAHVAVATPWGRVRVKVAPRPGGAPDRGWPEYEDCRAAARRHGVPLAEVRDAALAAWRSAREDPRGRKRGRNAARASERRRKPERTSRSRKPARRQE